MKGIIVADGYGTRLYPLTLGISKQLLPVYDKPMIYYPLSILMLAGIRQILIVSTPTALPFFQTLFKDGKQWGLSFSYVEQRESQGLADVFITGRNFIGCDPVCLILGDNIFYGDELSKQLMTAAQLQAGGIVFAYAVKDPERYNVIELDKQGRAISIDEKPQKHNAHYAIPGLYFYDNQVVQIAANLQPSTCGALEITDINRAYLQRSQLQVEQLGRGVAWLDASTHESLLNAAKFVQVVQERQGLMVACPEEIAYRKNFIEREDLYKLAIQMAKNQYADYLFSLIG